jgi:hypothetical protein
VNPPLTSDLGARFFRPRATCALCGREVDPDEAAPIAETDEPSVDVSSHGLHLHADVVPGERLVVCAECAAER